MTTTTTVATTATLLAAQCRQLRLPSVGARWESMEKEAVRGRLRHRAYLAGLLEQELEDRSQRRAQRRRRIQRIIATPVDYLRRESSTPQKPKRRKRPNGSPLCGPTRAARTKARPRTHPRASENELLRRGQPGQGERFRSVGARRRAARRRLRPVSSS
jgi:hypothetical protein